MRVTLLIRAFLCLHPIWQVGEAGARAHIATISQGLKHRFRHDSMVWSRVQKLEGVLSLLLHMKPFFLVVVAVVVVIAAVTPLQLYLQVVCRRPGSRPAG